MEQLNIKYVLLFVAGIGARCLIMRNPDVQKSLGDRVEVSTPLSSWKRAAEGASLSLKGVNPYDGDVFHEPPLFLLLYRHIYQLGDLYSPFVFIACDVLTAIVLALSAHCFLNGIVQREKSQKFSDVSCILLKPEMVQTDPFCVAAIYLFCPFTLVSCCGCSTAVFLNLLIAIFILMMVTERVYEASVVVGVISYYSLHHITLFAPVAICAYKNFKVQDSKSHNGRLSAVIFMYLSTFCGLLYSSYLWVGSWNFLMSTYGFMFFVSDLTPNLGVFWYFFIEMFEHFRIFFLWTFQLNVFVYSIPFSIRLRKEPMVLLFILLILITLFKPYPCLGDVGLYFAMIPFWTHLFRFMKQCFMVGCTFLSCVFLGPILWHLWVYNGSANANFYFGITLVFNAAQIFLFTDIASGYIRREFYLENGIKTDDEGKMRRLKLV